jgi:glycosyltransferase involved in cell wall biosynthesis
MSATLVALSDAVLGYGSPQIPKFMSSLGDHLGTRALILQPENRALAPKHHLYPEVDVETLSLKIQPYTTRSGRAEYINRLAERVNQLQPEVLVVFCTFTIPVLSLLNYRPRKVIYYSIESIVQYGGPDLYLNRTLAHMMDLIVFPEANRAALDSERCCFLDKPTVIFLNCVNDTSVIADFLPVKERNGRIIHQGSIGYDLTFAHYFLKESCQRYPVDIFGPFGGDREDELRAEFAAMRGNMSYKGQVDLVTLAEHRKHYSFGIVTWNPGAERGLFAPSNKFFEYVASGVPVITAPHPQHARIVERYGCGIVMPDWSFDAFLWTIEETLKLAGSSRMEGFVQGCAKAIREELNWDHQFGKFLVAYDRLTG